MLAELLTPPSSTVTTTTPIDPPDDLAALRIGGTPTRALIAMLASITATGPLAMQIFLPALPVVQADFASTSGIVQLTLSLSMAAIALSTLAYGPASDHFGRRPVLLLGLGVFVLGSLLCAIAPTVEWLIFGRVVQAAGGAAGMVLARAVVRDLFSAEQAGAVIAQLTMIMVVAPMIAPTIGGALTDVVHWRSVFLFAGATVLLVLLWVFYALPETQIAAGRSENLGGILRGFGQLLRSRRFVGYVGHTASSSVVFFSFISGAPYLMVTTLGRPATEYGLWFVLLSAGFMMGNYIAIRTSGRFPQLLLMGFGSLLALAAVLLTVAFVANDALSPATLFLPISFAMIGNGLAMPNAQAGALSVFPSRAGTASGFSGFAQMAVAALATQAVGVFQDGSALPMLFCMTLGCLGALASVMLVVKSPAPSV